jgi:hypothetical protein
MTLASTETLNAASLEALLGPHLTAEQAARIFQQGQDAVVFALLTLAKQRAEKTVGAPAGVDPSASSGQTPPYVKPPAQGRKKAKGAKPGHPGQRRPSLAEADRPPRGALALGLPQVSRAGATLPRFADSCH